VCEPTVTLKKHFSFEGIIAITSCSIGSLFDFYIPVKHEKLLEMSYLSLEWNLKPYFFTVKLLEAFNPPNNIGVNDVFLHRLSRETQPAEKIRKLRIVIAILASFYCVYISNIQTLKNARNDRLIRVIIKKTYLFL
jgi:hypothetical protein